MLTANSPHALRVIGSDEGVALVVCVVPGGGFDRFFTACAEDFMNELVSITDLVH